MPGAAMAQKQEVERKAVLIKTDKRKKPRRPADKNVPPPSLLWPPLFVRFSPHEPVVYPFQPPPQCSSPQNRQWSHLSLPPLSSSVLFPPSRFLCRFLDRSGDVSVQPELVELSVELRRTHPYAKRASLRFSRAAFLLAVRTCTITHVRYQSPLVASLVYTPRLNLRHSTRRM